MFEIKRFALIQNLASVQREVISNASKIIHQKSEKHFVHI